MKAYTEIRTNSSLLVSILIKTKISLFVQASLETGLKVIPNNEPTVQNVTASPGKSFKFLSWKIQDPLC